MRAHPGQFILALCVAMLLSACGDSNPASSPANMVFKTASLDGAQETPAVTTPATGSAFFNVDMGSGMIQGTVTTVGLTGVAAHIHEGPVGAPAGIIVPLTQGPTGTWTVAPSTVLTASQLDSLRSGNLYVNVHTAANPNGEIRGQIGREVYFATLTGAQEVPPVTTTATGTGIFVFDMETSTMTGTVTTSGITGIASHFHIAPIGQAAGVAIPFTGGPTNWTMPPTVLNATQLAALGAGSFYANVHSTANAGGEIRGQLYKPVRMASLFGSQEVPSNASTASGTGRFMVNPFTRAVAGRMEWSGVSGTDAHIHNAAAGVAGGIVVRGTVTTGNPGLLVIDSSTPLADNLLAAFMLGNLYYNVHSVAFPSGEIRGQLNVTP